MEYFNKVRLNRALLLCLRKQVRSGFARLLDLWALVSSSHFTCAISPAAIIAGRHISVGRNCLIEGGALLAQHDPLSKTEFIKIGDNCEIRRGAQIRSWMGWVSIGNDCSVNPNTVILGTGGIKIGDSVRIAGNCLIVASGHVFEDRSVPICKQGYTAKGVIIEDDVWIGAGVCVLDGVTIGRGSIIGAGAVVKQSVEPYSINAGVPSRCIRRRP